MHYKEIRENHFQVQAIVHPVIGKERQLARQSLLSLGRIIWAGLLF